MPVPKSHIIRVCSEAPFWPAHYGFQVLHTRQQHMGLQQSFDVTEGSLAHSTDEETSSGMRCLASRWQRGGQAQVAWEAGTLPLQLAVCPRVPIVCAYRRGEPSWGRRSSLNGGSGLGRYEIVNKKTSHLILLLGSGTEGLISWEHTWSKLVLSTSLHLI